MSAYSSTTVREVIPFGAAPDETRFFLLHLEHPRAGDGTVLWKRWKPGQFAMLRPAGWSFELPWARPLSICTVDDEKLVFFFQVVGRGTTRMKALRPGDTVNVWGPLGNSFAVEADTPTLLLAGGIGLAPFLGYSESHPSPEKLRLLFSHRAEAEAYPLELFLAVKPENRLEATLADRTVFLDEVRGAIAQTAAKSGLVLACGPTPFLAYIQRVALEYGCRAQLSLENRMACGVGACLGCVATPTEAHPVGGNDRMPVRTCVNGPVFWADQVDLEGA